MKSLLRLALAAGLLLAGTLGASAAASSKLVVAFLPKSKGNAYFISCKAGAEKAAKELGVELLFDEGETEEGFHGGV